ncbi:hypothetical protein MY4824_005276 [Beauveria thailandica]
MLGLEYGAGEPSHLVRQSKPMTAYDVDRLSGLVFAEHLKPIYMTPCCVKAYDYHVTLPDAVYAINRLQSPSFQFLQTNAVEYDVFVFNSVPGKLEGADFANVVRRINDAAANLTINHGANDFQSRIWQIQTYGPVETEELGVLSSAWRSMDPNVATRTALAV